MKKHISFVIVLLLAIVTGCQTKVVHSDLNLSFEEHINGIPTGWDKFGGSGYSIYLDSSIVQDGKYSAVIEYEEGEPEFKAWEFTLPDNYEGEQITLSGYIKTENITEGYAGLWLRIDPQISFDNMSDRGITGTTDWTRYEIILPMSPSKTQQIVFGGLLVGKGKMWLDNLSVTIDKSDIAQASIYVKPVVPADKDKEFDNGSAVVFPPLGDRLIADLELLGKLWGFLKYHHPAIGKGNYNWDYELFRILPSYLKTKNQNDRDETLLEWINKYGKVPVCTTCQETSPDAYLKPNLSWAENSNLNNELKKKIQEIYLNRHQGDHYYISVFPGVGNPEFLNEKSYSHMSYPDAGFRLLTLYKYWNMIQYFFPYKYITDKNWDNVLKEYIPQFISAENELEYELATLQIIGDTNDTHANLWGGGDQIDRLRGNNYAPFRVQFIEGKLVVTNYYNPELKEPSSPEVGDIVTHINGEAIDVIIEKWGNYYPASNKASKLRDISGNLLRSSGDSINIKYNSSGQVRQVSIPLYARNSLNMYYLYRTDKDKKCYRLLEGNIGYVTLATIKDEDVPIIKDTFKNTKGIIIDIRNYPSAFVPFTLGSYFVSKPTPFVKFTEANINNPGEFSFTPAIEIPNGDETYQGKLVVLVNEFAQSSSEYQTMAFRAGENTTIIGSTTAGADGNVSDILLPGGLRTMISGIGVYYPDGKETQRIGIVPDVKIEPTINGIKQGIDEILEKAIEIIKVP